MATFLRYLVEPPRRCRWCGNSKIDRLPPRGTFEVLLLPVLRLNVFSCHECLARYYSWKRFPAGGRRAEAERAIMNSPKGSHMPWKKQCPSCGSREVWRSHRQSIGERVASRVLRLWPLRCHDCGIRFYRISFRPPEKQSKKRHTVPSETGAAGGAAAKDAAQKR